MPAPLRIRGILRVAIVTSAVAMFTAAAGLAEHGRPVRWDDLPAPIHRRLLAAGVDAGSFSAFLRELEGRTLERVRESDLDALVYYALQSTAFTQEPPIEPALSAKAFVDGLDPETRARFMRGNAPVDRVPQAARRRLQSLLAALATAQPGSRLSYFNEMARGRNATSDLSETFLLEQYVRAMRFLYEKEFVLRDRPDRSQAIATLYRERGLSTDTAVEAGYLVHLGLATLKALDPGRRIRRVLIVGPGFDLAPRTGLLEAGPPQSYQPYAVLDSILALGLARLEELTVTGADVNPRVVEHLQRRESPAAGPTVLTLVSGVGNTESLTLQDDYRAYFDRLGSSIGESVTVDLPERYRGHLRKSVRVRREASSVVDAVPLDIATRRLDEVKFDLVVATNVFPYLDDVPLALALANLVAMLAPRGVLLHNEARPLVGDVTGELNVPLEHARTGIIASVRGGPPLYDSIFVHVKRETAVPRPQALYSRDACSTFVGESRGHCRAGDGVHRRSAARYAAGVP